MREIGSLPDRSNQTVSSLIRRVNSSINRSLNHMSPDWLTWMNYRSSRPEVFYKKGAYRNFSKFTGKRL